MPQITSIRKCADGDCTKKMSAAQIDALGNKIERALKKKGITCYYYFKQKGHGLHISGCYLTEEYRGKWGGNISARRAYYSAPTKRKSRAKGTRFLGWEDWVEFNETVNDVLDKEKISANVGSLQGAFQIRRGIRRMGREDWESGQHSNVGSMFNPIAREELYQSAKAGREGWRAARERAKRAAETRKRLEEAKKREGFEGLHERHYVTYKKMGR